MPQLAIISLKYRERYYQQTLDCLQKQPYDVFYADRNGVGNISKAFNEAFKKDVLGKYDYVWFITNITFDPDIPYILLETMEDTPDFGAIHPVFDSDHEHIQQKGSQKLRQVPFVEFTAPIFRCDVFEKFMLDEDHHYYYMDLIISKQLKEAGYKCGVQDLAPIDHVYLRNNTRKEQVTRKREAMRRQRDMKERKILAQKYGHNWQTILFNYDI